MDAHCINYADTGFFSKTITDYLDNDPALAPFYGHRPTFEGFEQLLKTKKVTADREVLVEVLTEQYNRLSVVSSELSVLSTQNIEALRANNTYTITTGHQLNIFTGPLYFIFKIATAIKLARQLKERFPDKNFVPVYWMASEDHDFAEINHTKTGDKKIEWPMEAAGATGRLATKTIRQALNQYKGVLGLAGNAPQLAEIVETAYTRFDKLADATRYLVNALFGEYGLVIIDADDARLKQQFAPIIEQDIIGQNSFKHISDSNAALQKLGVHIQVNPREINFFYLLDGLRERIVFENNVYEVLGSDIRFTEAELRTEIEQHPERFSPNVVMRPLYQEVILPNLAYIGGGAEVVYWLELKSNFDHYGIGFPVLILRNSGMLVTKEVASHIKNTGFMIADIFKPADALKTGWVKQHTEQNLTLNAEWLEMLGVFEKIKAHAAHIDATLAPSTDAIRARLKHAIESLERKMLKAEKRNHEVRLEQIDKFKQALFPGGGLQERSQNFGPFYVKWGQQLITDLIENFEPLEFKFTVLTE
ncbi:bacillithiol biosynthesis cysteine-adding enzyme BshC [Mucilaginibacter sp. PPCGB 2223]|uniref:bacillithiol biosynthesis cysteine-adding enzyme BshC n=1 Tax=Mucilaginibacter sp. PPCGB 2223 TaxID=1886027 RepID=UPI000826F61F|nr:bacillithiol biosynthesis cysteine-adding enzyme BshC [Mucilaginibacter sp. PPCGB 2223]OCX54662.1 bacillithiol biosynthesis cysteine-adding enzyme BshC [Mucilaginibacter sp. PPCGB 2223]